MLTSIGEICEEVPCVEPHTKSLEIDAIFKESPKLQGIIVKEAENFSLVMRTRFYERIGNRFGYNLYMERAIELIMNKKPLIVDYMEPILEVSQKAMGRPAEELYDHVIVLKEGECSGIVSIQSLLLTFAKIQKETALFMNPLSGLPGNKAIDHELAKLMSLPSFSVLYVDLDHFKSYNDTYGFKKGDDLILATAQLLTDHLFPQFVGHVGGDDFIAVLHHHDYSGQCQKIIADFGLIIKEFYSQEHLAQGHVLSENRAGMQEEIPLVSLSIAVVTDQNQKFSSTQHIVSEATKLKKLCKQHPFSCYLSNQLQSLLKG